MLRLFHQLLSSVGLHKLIPWKLLCHTCASVGYYTSQYNSVSVRPLLIEMLTELNPLKVADLSNCGVVRISVVTMEHIMNFNSPFCCSLFWGTLPQLCAYESYTFPRPEQRWGFCWSFPLLTCVCLDGLVWEVTSVDFVLSFVQNGIFWTYL